MTPRLYRPPPSPTPTILHSIGAPLFSGPIPETPPPSHQWCPTGPQLREAMLLLERADAGDGHDPHLWGVVEALRWVTGGRSEIPDLPTTLATHLPKLPP